MVDLSVTIENILASFPSTGLKNIRLISLFDRQDTKFVFHIDQLNILLTALSDTCRTLEIQSRRIFEYGNRYFDTPGFTLYLQHHNRLRSRYKVRMRSYPITGQTFLEIKEKNNRDRTAKARTPLEKITTVIPPEKFDFIRDHAPVEPQTLVHALDIYFSRITLVNTAMTERLTIDFNFRLGYPNPVDVLDTLVIAEIKQPRFSASSRFQKIFREMKTTEMRISKYCLGTLLCYPGIKYNRFKPKLRFFHRLTQNPIYREAVYPYGYYYPV